MRRKSKFNIDQTMLDMMTTLVVLFAALFGIWVMVAKIDVNKMRDEAIAMQLGSMTADARWPDGLDVDVDLWVQAPEDERAVGYSRRSDRQSSYVRDDIGNSNDPDTLNFENTFIRGLRAGRYIVNVHMYSAKGHLPVKVHVTAKILPSYRGGGRVIADREVELTRDGEEITAFSFELDDKGALVDGSISEAYIPLRSGGNVNGGFQ